MSQPTSPSSPAATVPLPWAGRRIEIYDTTLRDGTQGEGFSLSLEDKLLIATRLDALGVDYIEGGFPISNPKDEAFFKEIRTRTFKHAKISAFGMTRRRGLKASDDPGQRALLAAETPAVTIVGKTSPFQVQYVLSVTLDENVAMIGDSVRLMCEAGREVIYDAEHFFDTFRADKEYALRTLRAAEEAGARVLCLCDTNGGTMPEQIEEAVQAVRAACSATVGIHTHNDSGVALANGLAAIRAGAGHAQGTMNGVGERCGNMDLIPMIANLRLKYGAECLRGQTLQKLTDVSRYVYELANMLPVSGQPYTGPSAFAHKGGMHVHAVQKDASTYEHVDPAAVGNQRKILVSELSGASNIAATLGKKFDELASDKELQRRILSRVQDLENEGYTFEAADASLELILLRELGRFSPSFKLGHYRVVVERTDHTRAQAEATVKLAIGPATEHRVADGDGPVDALNRALRLALEPHLPSIKDLHLVDYKVRVLNSRDDTAAKVRVTIEFRGGSDGELFGTVGVDANIIDASWRAIVDAYEYHLQHSGHAAPSLRQA